MSRIILVGDVHGCLDELRELLARVEFRQGVDRLILLGDLMDRGPDPVGVVRLAQQIGAESVMGNHDEKHLRWRRHEARVRSEPGYKNPMKPMTDDRRAQNEALSDADIAWLASRPLTIRFDYEWIAVHAGFEPCLPLDRQRADKVMRVRYVNADGKMAPIHSDVDQPEGTQRWAMVWREPMHVVYGHHALSLEKPTVDTHVDERGSCWLRIGIDTACCFGGQLTALIIPDLRNLALSDLGFVSVPAAKTYATLWLGDSA